MSGISLNASMHSNLLSLQQTQVLQDMTQLRLSTGLKVNSAIDNPSSYYTASSLNNRAQDLLSLLDSMAQSIQTIKAANEALETATRFLQQAKATANQAMEKASPPKNTGYDGPIAATVTTEAELFDALNNADPSKGAIVIANDIALSKNIGLALKDNMKLVGKTGAEKLTFDFDSTTKAIGIELAKDTQVSGLVIDYTSVNKTSSDDFHAIRNNGYTGVKLKNLDITVKSDSTSAYAISGIHNASSGEVALEGTINLSAPSTTGKYIYGIRGNGTSSKITQAADSVLNITTSGIEGYGISYGTNILSGKVNITTSGSGGIGIARCTNTLSGTVHITTSGSSGMGIYNGTNSLSGTVNITTSGQYGYGIDNGTNTLSGTVNITTSGSSGRGINNGTNTLSGTVNITTSGQYGRGIIEGTNTLSSSAQLRIKIQDNTTNAIDFSKLSYAIGAKIGIESAKAPAGAGFWQATTNKTSTTDETFNTLDGVADWNRIGNFPGIPAPAVTRMLRAAAAPAGATSAPVEPNPTLDALSKSYNTILTQLNQLVKDAGYKGVNLLLENNLKVNFNEDRSSGLNVNGFDASTKGLGLTNSSWENQENIEASIGQLDKAINQIRSYSAEFGNYYSIVTTREEFTENLINVLTEGADKLTLADINEESANMLSLQTRQQLAINSLSLASQASQSVLKLF